MLESSVNKTKFNKSLYTISSFVDVRLSIKFKSYHDLQFQHSQIPTNQQDTQECNLLRFTVGTRNGMFFLFFLHDTLLMPSINSTSMQSH